MSTSNDVLTLNTYNLRRQRAKKETRILGDPLQANVTNPDDIPKVKYASLVFLRFFPCINHC